MFRWRRRNDGFEWRQYVRTTILVRRKQRRDRIADAGKAAVDNIKAAGHKGVAAGADGIKAVGKGAVHIGAQGADVGLAGAKALGRGAAHAGQKGAVAGAEGAKVLGRAASSAGRQGVSLGSAGLAALGSGARALGQRGYRLSRRGAQSIGAGAVRVGGGVRTGTPIAIEYLRRAGAWLFGAIAYAWAVTRAATGLIADWLAPMLAPVGALLRMPGLRTALLIGGSVALAGGVIRAFANGMESDTWIALSVGIGVLAMVALAELAAGVPGWLATPLRKAGSRSGEALGSFFTRPAVQAGAMAGLVLLVIGGGVAAWRGDGGESQITTASTGKLRTASIRRASSGEVTGRADAITGDMLRVGSKVVRLEGIEAPVPGQVCKTANGRTWLCGRTARQVLSGLLAKGRVTCQLRASSDEAAPGTCYLGDMDLAGQLVRDGAVFARQGFFATYGRHEQQAEEAKAGVWAGTADRPSEYRDQKWQEATKAAPEGCPIKGNVRRGRKVYVLPWARGYERFRVVRSRGERWFCSEEEARSAGFSPIEES